MVEYNQEEFEDNAVSIDSETLSTDFDNIDLYGEIMVDDEEDDTDILWE